MYGARALRGPLANGFMCDWPWAADGNYTAMCTSKLDSCECPGIQPDSLATSAIGKYMEDSAAYVYAGPALLWGLTLILPALYLLLDWKKNFSLPRAFETASTTAWNTWIALCVLTFLGLIAFGALAPANIWGECAQRGRPCIHEAGSAVRASSNPPASSTCADCSACCACTHPHGCVCGCARARMLAHV